VELLFLDVELVADAMLDHVYFGEVVVVEQDVLVHRPMIYANAIMFVIVHVIIV
jgi:hypothetical protein